MTSAFHSRNERIKKALARRAQRKALAIYDEEMRRGHVDVEDGDFDVRQSRDGRVVRNPIDDEETEYWNEQ